MKCYGASLLVAFVAAVALAQATNGPAQPPPMQSAQSVQIGYDGKCANAKAGDLVNFTLTIEAVDKAKAVYGELQLRQGRGGKMETGLPAPDFRNLAGGGLGVRDSQSPNMYHFAFKVPAGLVSGVYHGVGVLVTADKPVAASDPSRDVDVTRRTRDEVKKYCLNVMSGLEENGRPLVTGFKPDGVQGAVAPVALPK